jgi:hypothetical protein
MSIWKLLTTVNPQLDIEAIILDMLLGGLLFMTIAAFINALRKKSSPRRPVIVIVTMIGMTIGAYWPVFRHNAMMELAGHFIEEPDYYDTEIFANSLQWHENEKDNVVIFYAAGALPTPGGFPSDNYKNLPPNTFVFAHCDEKKIARAINAVPQGYKVVLMGHSTGGSTALRAAHMANRKIDWLITMDAIEMDFLSKYIYKSSGKPVSVESWQNMLPLNWQMTDRSKLTDEDSDYWATGNPLRMMHIKGSKIIYNSPDHGMFDSGMRRHWDMKTNYGGIYEIRRNIITKLYIYQKLGKIPVMS